MALIELNIYSNALGTDTAISVILPRLKKDSPPSQVLYNFHGGRGDHTFGSRYTDIERLAGPYNLAVVTPTTAGAGRVKVRNIPYGEQWWDYYSEELPEIINNMFRVSASREDTFAMGGSGGGYAVLKLALEKPEMIGAVAGMCPMLLSRQSQEIMKAETPNDRFKELAYYFGDPFPDEYDIYKILETAGKKDLKSAMFLCCGTEDGLFPLVSGFRDKAIELGFEPAWDERPGAHTMEYGAEMLPVALDWLPLKKL